MNVYFISGMCANCHVFDQLKLPEGYTKQYIEWLIPSQDESLDTYLCRLIQMIDTTQPFVIVGYSFGGVMAQEISNILSPEKTILISSMKSVVEIPSQIRWSKKIRFADRIFKRVYFESRTIIDTYVRLMLGLTGEEAAHYISYTSFDYMYWSIKTISEWQPKGTYRNLYHIHGTKDRTFPRKQIKDVFFIEGGDHLMVVKQSEQVNTILAKILLSD